MDNDRLELEQDMAFQKREWRLQRIAWVAWAGLVIAGLVGLVGSGPLSRQEISSSDGRLTVTYNRFVHYHHSTTLEVMMQPENETDDQLRLQISQSLLDRMEIQRIEPEPSSRELASDGTWYIFRCAPGVPSAKVMFHVEYDDMGRGAGELQLAGSEPVVVTHFVYP
jgi:hypothetical protein